MEPVTWRTAGSHWLAAGLVAVLAFGLSSCGSDGSTGPPPPPPPPPPGTPPVISLSGAAIALTQEIGSPASSESFEVSNTGGESLDWTASATEPWVELSATSGSLAGGASTTVNVTSDGSLFGTGTYQATISVSGNANNSPQNIVTSLAVSQTGPLALSNGLPSSEISGGAGSELLFQFDIASGSPSIGALRAGGSDRHSTSDPSAPGGSDRVHAPAPDAADRLGTPPLSALVNSLLEVALHNGTGNADLYVRQGQPPTVSQFDCSSTGTGNDELCQIFDPASGTWFVLVRGGGSFQGTKVEATFLEDVAPPSLEVTPTSLDFSAVEGSDPVNQSITITNDGGITSSWSGTSDEAWLSLTQSEGTLGPAASANVGVRVASADLPPGSYSGTITISDEAADDSPKTVTVDLVVTAAPTIGVDPASLQFDVVQGSNPPDQDFEVSNLGGGTLAWTGTTDSPDEIEFAPTSGSLGSGASQTVNVSLTTEALAPGNYVGTITITDNAATNSPQTVEVHVTVTPPGLKQLRVVGATAATGNGRVVSSPSGIDCTVIGDLAFGTCDANFDEGASVTLTAAPAAGNQFTAWAGPCQGGGLCTVTLDDNTTAIAQFDDDHFEIEVRYTAGTSPTGAQQMAFDAAEARWEEIVTMGLPDVPISLDAGECNEEQPAVNETIDDLAIYVTLKEIDGVGGVLGQAGPCIIRSSGDLTVLGIMEFDTADLVTLENNGQLPDVILHEMGHVLGYGAVWTLLDLIEDPALSGGTDPHFTGPLAIASFDDVGGAGYTGAKVPVEDTGGAGTADAHWRESVMGNELMTGFIGGTDNPLSEVTISSMADMGYHVDVSVADAYTITLSLRQAGDEKSRIQLVDDLRHGLVFVIDGRGRIVRTLREREWRGRGGGR